jgi:hypothetical protein
MHMEKYLHQSQMSIKSNKFVGFMILFCKFEEDCEPVLNMLLGFQLNGGQQMEYERPIGIWAENCHTGGYRLDSLDDAPSELPNRTEDYAHDKAVVVKESKRENKE